ncbi:MAG: cbb3-type cytochrome c oxidase subunit I [Solirubrobacterales bacterium]|nr:cbb3-type cytochrome c oxidase subunit I [Solirubrobacterales bacterium]
MIRGATASPTGRESSTVLHPLGQQFSPASDRPQNLIGWIFGGTGLALFALMALVGLGMRLVQAETIAVSPQWFYRLMTLHAAGMLAGALLSMMGGLWLVVRSVVPGLSFGRAIASWLAIVLGVVLVLVSVLIGGFAAGWTFLFPLPFEASGQWSTWAAVTFIVGMGLVGVGFLVYCIDVLRATTQAYGGLTGALGIKWLRGKDPTGPPPQVIAATAVTLQGIICSAVGMTIVMALLDHTIDGDVALDALWAKNLTYFFGHTIANLIIYLAVGMVYVLVPLYAGRQWKLSKPMAIGWLFTIAFVMTAYSHHLYMDFVQPGAPQMISLVASSAAAIPVAVVTIYSGMMLIWGSRFRWTLTSVLLYLGFAGWAIGGSGAVIDSLIPINFRLHNTLWVPAHFHNYLMMGVGLWMMAMVAFLLERAAGRPASRRTTIWAPLLMVAGGYGFVFSWYISGALGIPRRWAVHPAGTEGYSLVASVFAVVFLVGFIMLMAEFISLARTALERRRASSAGPTLPSVAGASGEADPGLDHAADPLLRTPFGIAVTVGLALVASFALLPPISDASEATVGFHHLAHGAQFFIGSMLAVALASSPSIARSVTARWTNAGLVTVVLVPAGMLLFMVPAIYSEIDTDNFLHASYHFGVLILGFITGLGASTLGRTAGWTVLISSIGMALMFAAGVTGG